MKNNIIYIILLLTVPLPVWSQYRGGAGRSKAAVVAGTNQLDGTMPKLCAGSQGRGETIFIQPAVQLDGVSEKRRCCLG